MAEYCGECAHLDLNNKETYTSRDRYYCNECHRYRELTEKACYSFLRNPSQGKENGGYTPSGCYLSTIIVNVLGYSDNCNLLQILRNFREKVLKVVPEYLDLLFEYDTIGPIISEKIANYENRMDLCLSITNDYIIPYSTLISKGEYIEAISLYRKMLNALKSFFKIEADFQMPSQEEISKIDYETLGKGRIRAPKLVTD